MPGVHAVHIFVGHMTRAGTLHGESPGWQADPPFPGGCLPLCCPPVAPKTEASVARVWIPRSIQIELECWMQSMEDPAPRGVPVPVNQRNFALPAQFSITRSEAGCGKSTCCNASRGSRDPLRLSSGSQPSGAAQNVCDTHAEARQCEGRSSAPAPLGAGCDCRGIYAGDTGERPECCRST